MEILYIMVFCSILLAFLFLGIFIFATKKGQFDDGESPAVRVLFDNNQDTNKETNNE